VVAQSATVVTQMQTVGSSGRIFRRTRNAGTWTGWLELVTKGSIGSGDLTGTGSPEGVITAPVGTYYTDTALTNGAMRWAKKSGAGNTGWKAVEGDTGWRDIRSLYGTTVAQLVDNAVCGRIKRVNSTVTYQALVYPAGATIGATRSALIPNLITAIPAGFAPDGNQPLGQASYSGNVGMVNNLITGSRFDVQMPTLTGTWGAADLISASATWVTSAAWPTTLPGVAATPGSAKTSTTSSSDPSGAPWLRATRARAA
jgi:hypothetical protein